MSKKTSSSLYVQSTVCMYVSYTCRYTTTFMVHPRVNLPWCSGLRAVFLEPRYFRPKFKYNSHLLFIFSSIPIITNILSTEASLHQLNIITTFLKTILREALNCTECIPKVRSRSLCRWENRCNFAIQRPISKFQSAAPSSQRVGSIYSQCAPLRCAMTKLAVCPISEVRGVLVTARNFNRACHCAR